MKTKNIQQMFERDIANHTMRIHKDDGLYRHIEFSDNGSFDCRFYLVTWPGYLSIVGDCGDFTFKRTEDMFSFFRRNDLSINPGYWGEKICAGAFSNGGREISKSFSIDKFKARVCEWFNDAYPKDGNHSKKLKREVWEEVKEEILEVAEDEFSAVTAIRGFDNDHLDFCDFWEVDCHEWKHHYLWCLYAIVWGIQQYDRLTSKVTA